MHAMVLMGVRGQHCVGPCLSPCLRQGFFCCLQPQSHWCAIKSFIWHIVVTSPPWTSWEFFGILFTTGQDLTLRHREPWPTKSICLWDHHCPDWVPCPVGLAVAVDLLALQPTLGWPVALTELVLRGQEQPQGRLFPAPAVLILPKGLHLPWGHGHPSLQMTVIDFQSLGNACDYFDRLVVEGEDLWPLTLSVLC